MVTTQQTVTNCRGGGEDDGGGGGGGGCGGGGGSQKTHPYAAATDTVEEVEAQEVEVEVDEVKMEAEDHLAREYVQEFVLDHLDPADVKREVSGLDSSRRSSVRSFFFLPFFPLFFNLPYESRIE